MRISSFKQLREAVGKTRVFKHGAFDRRGSIFCEKVPICAFLVRCDDHW